MSKIKLPVFLEDIGPVNINPLLGETTRWKSKTVFGSYRAEDKGAFSIEFDYIEKDIREGCKTFPSNYFGHGEKWVVRVHGWFYERYNKEDDVEFKYFYRCNILEFENIIFLLRLFWPREKFKPLISVIYNEMRRKKIRDYPEFKKLIRRLNDNE